MDAKTARQKVLSIRIRRYDKIVENILKYISEEVEKEKFECSVEADFDECKYIISELTELGYIVSSEPDSDSDNLYSITIKW